MDDNLVEYRLERHSEKLKEHDVRLKEHDEQIRKLSENSVKLSDSIDALNDNMKSGFGVVKWIGGMFLVQIVGFFFFMVQSLF